MFGLILDIIGAICAVLLIGYLVRACLPGSQNPYPDEASELDDYLRKITRITGFSVYDTFHKSAEDWHVPADRINKDFTIYLSTQSIPYYVKDFIRKSQNDIDELYGSKGNASNRKRLVAFFTLLTLFLWGGAILLSLYVIPYFLPDEYRAMFFYGPP